MSELEVTPGVFDDDPDGYHPGRPGYPAAVYEILASRCGLRPDCRVLEIGPGTGQATRVLLKYGARVTAVELGAHLAARLRAELSDPALEVIAGDIVEVDLPRRHFDLAVCATAFHWLDPATAMPVLADAVRPDGWLAVWWTVFRDTFQPPLWRQDLAALYGRHLPTELRDRAAVPAPLQQASRIEDLETGGWFGSVRADLLRWQHRMSAARARRLFATFPTVKRLAAPQREAFLDDLVALIERDHGGEIVDSFVTVVYTAFRRHVGVPRQR
jgi:SAM-dependent methyltransferase